MANYFKTMESLLKQLAILRGVNYCNVAIAAGTTCIQSFEESEYVLLSAGVTLGLLIAALVINGLMIEVKQEH